MNFVKYKTRYYGKQNDSTSAVIEMALSPLQPIPFSHIECLTARPFGLCCHINFPKQWLIPFKEPWAGLTHALKILDVQYNSESINISKDSSLVGKLLATAREWVKLGPVIIGPLNRAKIWDRVSSKYYSGDAYFILVLEIGQDNYFLIHDPEGCPNCLISDEKLIIAMKKMGGVVGVLQVTSIQSPHPSHEILLRGLVAGIDCHRAANNHKEGGANGLYALANEIALRRLKSSEEAALYFALPAVGLALTKLNEFFFDFSITFTDDLPELGCLSEQIFSTLQTYRLSVAKALDHLTLSDQKGLYSCFIEMAQHEERLSELYSKLMDILYLHLYISIRGGTNG